MDRWTYGNSPLSNRTSALWGRCPKRVHCATSLVISTLPITGYLLWNICYVGCWKFILIDLELWQVGSFFLVAIASRVRVADSVAHIGPVAVHNDYQGKGIGKMLLDFAESLAETSEMEVVSCRTDVLPIYERRGYKTIGTVPITDYLHPSELTRLDLEFLILRKTSVARGMDNEQTD